MRNRSEQFETQPTADYDEVTISLPEGTPDWNDSTVYVQRIHEALVSKGWSEYGPS